MTSPSNSAHEQLQKTVHACSLFAFSCAGEVTGLSPGSHTGTRPHAFLCSVETRSCKLLSCPGQTGTCNPILQACTTTQLYF